MATLFGAQDRLNQLLQESQARRTQQQQQLARQAMMLAETPQQAGVNAVGATFGAGLGQGLAQGLFGESDIIKQARGQVGQEAALRERLANIDINDPVQLAELSKEFVRIPGLEQQGLAFGQRAIELAKQSRTKEKLEATIKNTADSLRSQGYDSLASAVENQSITPEKAIELSQKTTSLSPGQVLFDASGKEITNVPEKASEKTKPNVTGLGRFVTPDGKVQTGRYVTTDGQTRLEIRSGENNWVVAPADTIPERGTLVSGEDKSFSNLMSLESKYAERTTDLRKQTDELIRLRSSLETGTNKDTQAALARLFGNKIRSNKELEGWANIGTLDQRFFNAINSFLGGDYTDDNKRIIAELIATTADEVQGKWDRVNSDFSKKAKAGNVDPELLLTTDTGFTDYRKMAASEIRSRMETTLSPLEEILMGKELERRKMEKEKELARRKKAAQR